MNRVVLGTQWGDEGKGAVVDRMCQDSEFDIVVRPAGGNNAGHRVEAGGRRFNLHQIPAGIIQGKAVALGSGMAINPIALVNDEMKCLATEGLDLSRVFISDRASLVMLWHLEEDRLREECGGTSSKIGTTRWGIGQCYRDDADRIGLRAAILGRSKDEFLAVIREKLDEATIRLAALYPASFNALDYVAKFPFEELLQIHDLLAPLVGDLPNYIWHALDQGKNILVECAQGTMLDLRYGTYQYVTSSHPTIAGALDGAALNPFDITDIVGVAKAYTTRVGLGPFPTRMDDTLERAIRERGQEFGTTTGRPRDCGWLDLVQLKYACRLNGVTGLVITKIDILSDIEKIGLCVAYQRVSEKLDYVPADLGNVVPIYAWFEGWNQDLNDCENRADLPSACRRYLSKIEGFLKVPIVGISKGPDRVDAINFFRE